MGIKLGIVGCGSIAGRHAQAIHEHPGGELVAAFDIKPERGQAFGKKFNCAIASSYEELLAMDIDIINVCTPNGCHFENTAQALKKKKNVLVEKPMALKREHCEEMINIALKNNRQLFVVKQNRFNPPVQAMKKLLDEEKLGNIYYVLINCFWNRNKEYYINSDWKGDKQLDGGTLFTQFSHFVDILYYLFGDIKDMNGIITNASHQDLIDFEDTGSFNFRFKSGAAIGNLNYTTSSYLQNMEGSLTVFAENATIKIGGKYLNVIEYQKTNGFDITGLPQSGPANQYGYYEGSMSNHDKMIANVIDALEGRSAIMANAMEGMKVVEIIENMYQAARWNP